jgi:hypothetical protein
MSLSTLLQAPRTVTIDGIDIEFPRITIYDLSILDESRKVGVKATAQRNAKEAGLEKADIYNICMDVDSRDFTIGEMLNYATTSKGAVSVLERSLVKQGMKVDDAKKLVEKMKPIEVLNLAQDLIIQPDKEDLSPEKKVDTKVETPSESSTSTLIPNGQKSTKPEEPLGFGE